ncbi:MAG TPA: tetratricopeptide repeat protein, partial [Nitrospirales bacterium]|nr:tetratricopeptide repeat protein [Nitrospirales bacterium]
MTRPVQILIITLILPLLTIACAVSPQAGTMTVQSAPSPFPTASEVVHSQHHDAYFQFMLAVHDELSRNVDAAHEKYTLALESDPSSPYLHARLAAIYAGKKQEDRAIEHVDAALTQPEIDVVTRVLLADVLVKFGLRERAVKLYDTVIERDSANPDVFVKKGVLLLSLNELDAAKQALRRSIEIRPDLPIAYYHLGRVALGQDEPEHAIQYFERAISGKQDFLPAYLALAKVHEERGAISEAIGLYRTTLDTLPGPLPLLRSELIRLYLGEHSYEPALLLLKDILHEDPHNLEATLRVGLIYVEQKQFEKAAVRLQAVLSQRPNDVMVRDYLGLIFEQSEAYEKAIEQYQQVLTIDDQYLDTIFHLGHLYYRLKNFGESVPLLRKAVQLEPQRIDSYLVLALGLTRLERYHDAVGVLQRGIALDTGVPDLHYHLGIVHEKLDQADKLIAHMEKTINL